MIIKKYPLFNFYEPFQNILERTLFIESFTKDTNTPVFFDFFDDYILRKSKKIIGKKINYGKLNNKQKNQLANILDFLHSKNFIHGDINRKNILIDKNNDINLIDFEPSLYQIINGKKNIMYTFPWIDVEDKQNNILTVKTDLLCFYRIINNSELNFFRSNGWNDLKNDVLNKDNPFYSLLKNKGV